MHRIAAIVLLFAVSLNAQTFIGAYTSHTTTGSTVTLNAGSSALRLQFYESDIIRVDFLPTTETVLDSSPVVIRDTSSQVLYDIEESGSELIIRTSDVSIKVYKIPLRLEFYNSSGKLLLSDRNTGGFATDGDERAVGFDLQPDEKFYGTGERGINFNLRGRRFESYNLQVGGYGDSPPTMNLNVPFLASTNGYALYFENTWRGFFDLGYVSPNSFVYETEGGELSYFFIEGETIPEQIEKYTWLTGRQPMPPKWSLGFIQSKYGYENETEARYMVETMRGKGIPCDAIVLDLYWFRFMGDISWNLDRFPQPFEMMRDFLDTGMKTIVITEPYLTEPSLNYAEAVANGYTARYENGEPYRIGSHWSCGCPATLLDMTNPAAREWWWSKHPQFFGDELAGIWTDLGEPEQHPLNLHHYMGTTYEVHNIYNLLWAETIYNGYNDMRPGERLFNLTRSGYAGMQRYSTFPWSGDVSSTWAGLAAQLPFLLNNGISGFAYQHSDIGGFCCGNVTSELYVRWMQFGAFSGIMRAHGISELPQEPWQIDEETEAISKKHIELRYQLLPYTYTLAYENHETGIPLARPLFFNYPGNPDYYEISDTYLWGDNLLVSPVVKNGQIIKYQPFPEGTWYNWWNDEPIEGGRSKSVYTPLDEMLLYAKEGSIIPMQPIMNYVDERPLDTLFLAVYPSEQPGEFTMYEDDGKTTQYENGAYALTQFTQLLDAQNRLTLNIGAAAGIYNGKPESRVYIPEIRGVHTSPASVSLGDALLTEAASYGELRESDYTYYYDTDTRRLYAQIPTSPDSSYTLSVENLILTSIDNEEELPAAYTLAQNYPNPFNPGTTISYAIPEGAHVSLVVYDILGRAVNELVNGYQTAGSHQVEFDAAGLSSGVYFYTLKSGGFVETKKMVILK